jgi:DNA helicase IV
MLAHFRADWDRFIAGGYHLNQDTMLLLRRNLARETLRGEYVKSYGEKVIANYLFEHAIPYRYEQNHNWSGFNYRPDFTLPKSGDRETTVIIEYFGLAGDPDYDDERERKREYWESKGQGWKFIELTPKDISSGPVALEAHLKGILDGMGIQSVRLTEDEIWQLAKRRAIDRFTKAIAAFIGRCRKAWILPSQLRDRIIEHRPLSDIEGWFIDLAFELYQGYLDRLKSTNQDDFDGLMQLRDCVSSRFTDKSLAGRRPPPARDGRVRSRRRRQNVRAANP